MRRLAVLCATSAVIAACSGTPVGSGLTVTVKFAPASKSQCVIVGVTSVSTGATTEAKPLTRSTRDLIVGVEHSASLFGEVTPYAHGFVSADCSGSSWIEEAQSPAPVDLNLPGVQQVTLTLDTPATDGGCVASSSEICGDGVDNDCNGLTDCLDLVPCQGQSCDDQDACTLGDVCRSDGSCRGTAKSCSAPGTCEVAPGTCAAGLCSYDAGVGLPCVIGGDAGACRSDKTCINGEVFCGNGVDDDLDGLTDCADSDCANQACDAGPSKCIVRATCVSNACTGTLLNPCTPPGACFSSAGACNETVGCPFSQADAGSACDGGVCQPDGGCAPAEQCGNGIDDDGDGLTDCADPDCGGRACNDGNACTSGETCSGGVCGGGAGCPTTTCSGPASCTPVDGGGVCTYPSPPVNAPCPGGVCTAAGTCSGAGFTYPPSTFNPQAVQVPDASVLINCVAEFDTTPVNNDAGFRSWCGPRPFVYSFGQDGGGEAVTVLVMPGLTVTDAGAIYLVGSQPAVLAVFGDAFVGGRIIAGPRPGATLERGAGGSLPASATSNAKLHCLMPGTPGTGGDGISNNNTSGGGGGGAFGATGGTGGVGVGASGSAGAPGIANGNPELIPLRGGCAGGWGGDNPTPSRSKGGFGGGALQLSVSGTLTTYGAIGAPGIRGSGGEGSDAQNGGAGAGGSGGAVLLEAQALRLWAGAVISANGGGGGGADGDPGAAGGSGAPGEDGHVTDVLPADGGVGGIAGGGRGGDGGTGGTLGASARDGRNGTAGGGSKLGGGGGAGGSVGRIRINAISCSNDGGLLSPAATGTACP